MEESDFLMVNNLALFLCRREITGSSKDHWFSLPSSIFDTEVGINFPNDGEIYDVNLLKEAIILGISPDSNYAVCLISFHHVNQELRATRKLLCGDQRVILILNLSLPHVSVAFSARYNFFYMRENIHVIFSTNSSYLTVANCSDDGDILNDFLSTNATFNLFLLKKNLLLSFEANVKTSLNHIEDKKFICATEIGVIINNGNELVSLAFTSHCLLIYPNKLFLKRQVFQVIRHDPTRLYPFEGAAFGNYDIKDATFVQNFSYEIINIYNLINIERESGFEVPLYLSETLLDIKDVAEMVMKCLKIEDYSFERLINYEVDIVNYEHPDVIVLFRCFTSFKRDSDESMKNYYDYELFIFWDILTGFYEVRYRTEITLIDEGSTEENWSLDPFMHLGSSEREGKELKFNMTDFKAPHIPEISSSFPGIKIRF